MRYLSIWELDHVTDPEFFDVRPDETVSRCHQKTGVTIN
jgi:hypothetical protein